MTNRTRFLLILAGVLAVAAWLTRTRPDVKPLDDEFVRVVVAGADMEPYTTIEPSEVRLGPAPGLPAAQAAGYHTQLTQVIDLMTTRFIKAGQEISRVDARPIEEVRYVRDMELEIVSFPAVFSEMVAGQVQPGHKVNIYGYRKEGGRGMLAETILVAGNVWVVDVRTSGGAETTRATPEAPIQGTGGLLTSPSARIYDTEPASVLAVAAPPEVVIRIIDALGAQEYQAWVTLSPSPNYIPIVPTRTPIPEPTAVPEASPPEPGLLPHGLIGAIYMSHTDDGPKVDVFPNSTSMVWAVVGLQYSPNGPLPIRIEVRTADGDAAMVFERDEVHPQSGQESYLVNPPGGFSPNTKYKTTVRAGTETFTVHWELSGDTPLPFTGEDDAGPGNN